MPRFRKSPSFKLSYTGGTNFDAKLRRQSLDPEDLLLAHIGAMDTCALGFRAAAKALENEEIKNFVKKRYSAWGHNIGKKLKSKKLDLDEISKWVEDNDINPQPVSGKQELLENIINNSLLEK